MLPRPFDWNTMKKAPPLLILMGMTGVGAVGAALMSLRMLMKSPDVTINKNDKEPWQKLKGKQYLFYTTRTDFECKAPDYKEGLEQK